MRKHTLIAILIASTILGLKSSVYAANEPILYINDNCKACEDLVQSLENKSLDEESDLITKNITEKNALEEYNSAVKSCTENGQLPDVPLLYYENTCYSEKEEIEKILQKAVDTKDKNSSEVSHNKKERSEPPKVPFSIMTPIFIIGIPALFIFIGYLLITKLFNVDPRTMPTQINPKDEGEDV